MIKGKKAVSALVATVLLILVTVAAVGIIWGAIMPMLNRAMEMGQACMNARLTIDATRGYTCYDETKKQVSVMVSRGAEDFNLAGIQIGLVSGGQVTSHEIRPDPYTKLLLYTDRVDGSTSFIDNSPNTKTVTAYGNAQIDTAQSKFGGSSALFDGTGDDVSLADSDDWNFGTGDFTLEGWIRFNSVVAEQGLMGQYTASPDDAVRIIWNNVNNHLTFYAKDGGSVVASVWSTFTPSADTWYHIAVVRYGTGQNNLYIFVDGVSQTLNWATNLAADASLPDVASVWSVGQDGSGFYLNGWIDEPRISKGIARWTSNFNVPISQYAIPAVSLPNQNEAKTYRLSGEDITEATVAPVVRTSSTEKTCDVTNRVQMQRCT